MFTIIGRIKHSTTSISGPAYSKHHTNSTGFKFVHPTDSKTSIGAPVTQTHSRYNNYETNRSSNYSRSSEKFSSSHHQQKSGSNGYSSTYPYKRRPFSSQNNGYASKYSSSSNYHHRSNVTDNGNNYFKSTWKANQATTQDSSENKENSTIKPLFNEGKIICLYLLINHGNS